MKYQERESSSKPPYGKLGYYEYFAERRPYQFKELKSITREASPDIDRSFERGIRLNTIASSITEKEKKEVKLPDLKLHSDRFPKKVQQQITLLGTYIRAKLFLFLKNNTPY